jgi:hypothetical protein
MVPSQIKDWIAATTIAQIGTLTLDVEKGEASLRAVVDETNNATSVPRRFAELASNRQNLARARTTT